MIALLSYAPTSLADATGSSALVDAVVWLQDALLGTVATTVAVIAVAAVGFGMLTGRINLRHGITVVMGCFILFGARGIVSGLRYASGGGGEISTDTAPPPVTAATTSPQPAGTPASYDPYAGASVPVVK